MCGRFTLSQPTEALAGMFQLDEVPELKPSYNTAPSQKIAAVLVDHETKKRRLKLLQWGLIPSWAKEPSIGSKLINARAETLAEKPSFRAAFKRRRCLIPADGFYEWQKQERGKQPYFIRRLDHQPFAFAGLWETWQDITTCTIITTNANELLESLHGRMPVILKPEDYEDWLGPDYQETAELQSLLKPFPAEQMEVYPVSDQVNSPANDRPDCIAPQSFTGG